MKMAITERSSCFLAAGSYLVALFIFLSSCSEMSGVAVISCVLGETYAARNTTTGFTGQCKFCPTEIESQCMLLGRPVSTIECNWWDSSGAARVSVCEGCCGLRLPTPSPPITRECQAGDIDESFPTPASPPWDCGRCQDGCKRKCEFWDTAVAREMCYFMRYDGEEIYVCNCCCRENTLLPSPPPLPSPSLPPPCPSPSPSSPPPVPAENICKDGDVYLSTQLFNTHNCRLGERDCMSKCSLMGSTLAKHHCTLEPSAASVVLTSCCISNL